MPGTPDQTSFVVTRPVFVQLWLNGSVWGTASAKAAPAARQRARVEAAVTLRT
jgi:hypothetical protein